MLFRRFYYTIKPFVPWRVRMAVRRAVARHLRARYADAWPILPGSEKPPEGWPGWPGGKKFAFVLTHDVEGQAGLEKVSALMELEMSLGFRSAFYFIPEGEYRVPRELRDKLVSNGFEVGVHDLYHDGKLFNSRRRFRRHAAKINHYLREWGAVGFRAGFMLHQLDWLHDLEIQYDASTFDTDPFEPQPEGVGTVFPFFVEHHSQALTRQIGAKSDDGEGAESGAKVSGFGTGRGGYVEIPYTLPQDITLFLLFKESSIDIWRRKLDWIAENGGLALVDVHPDYFDFDGTSRQGNNVPIGLYIEFLHYVLEKHNGMFWHCLPRDVARFIRGFSNKVCYLPKRRVCMLTYSYYETDNRVIRYAEALAEQGYHVDVLAVRRSGNQPKDDVVNGVFVHRIQTRSRKREQTTLGYLIPVLRFFFGCSLWLAHAHFRAPYNLVHAHNVPDFLVLAALVPKLTGAKVILDIHDILPEFYASKFARPLDSVSVRVLRFIERTCAQFADHVILSNHLWRDKYVHRAAPAHKCSVFINYVDTRMFYPRPQSGGANRIVLMFPGGLQWHQGVDIAIRAMPKVLAQFPGVEFHVYGDGKMKPALLRLVEEMGLNGKVLFFDPLPVVHIAASMANATIGVVPKRADSFGDEAFSTKILEFMAVGVPVIVSRTRIDQYYFNDTIVRFFEAGNPGALADVILDVLSDQQATKRQVERALAFARKNSWEEHKHEYLALVNRLCQE